MEVRIGSQASPDRLINEDYAFALPGLAGVLDGVSIPVGLESGCIHDPSWYVRRLAVHLAHAHVRAMDASLADGLADAIRAVRREHNGTCDLEHPGTPASTVCLLKDLGDHVEYLVLCDSPLVLDLNSEVRVVTDERFATVVADVRQTALTGEDAIGSDNHAARVRRAVSEQRRRINVADGYWIAAANPDAAHHAIIGSVPIGGDDGVRRAALMTDGASCAVDVFQLMNWRGLLDLLTSRGPQTLINQVRAAEQADSEGQTRPRYKRHDDATAALCLFDQEQPR